jgi:hypothetical protein
VRLGEVGQRAVLFGRRAGEDDVEQARPAVLALPGEVRDLVEVRGGDGGGHAIGEGEGARCELPHGAVERAALPRRRGDELGPHDPDADAVRPQERLESDPLHGTPARALGHRRDVVVAQSLAADHDIEPEPDDRDRDGSGIRDERAVEHLVVAGDLRALRRDHAIGDLVDIGSQFLGDGGEHRGGLGRQLTPGSA